MIEEARCAADPFVRFADLQDEFDVLSRALLQRCAEFRACALRAAPVKPVTNHPAVVDLALARHRKRARQIHDEIPDMLRALAQAQHQALLLAQHCLLAGRNSLHQLHDAIVRHDARLPDQVVLHATQSVAALREATGTIERVVAISARRTAEVQRAAAEVAHLARMMA